VVLNVVVKKGEATGYITFLNKTLGINSLTLYLVNKARTDKYGFYFL